MGGSGKTTLAQCIYNLNKQDFESNSFVDEIGKHYKHGVLGLQKQLLRDLLGGKKIRISSISEGTHKIEEVLQKKKVFIVLEDIDDKDELSTLLGTKAFPTHSKIIITTRLLNIHAWFGSISWRCQVHKLELLNDLESLELLSWHAFRSKIPIEGFEEVAVQLAQYCGGNPLALKVLGSSLFVRDEDPRTINSMKKIWTSRINSLNSMKGDLDYKIRGVLQKSFESLPLVSQKELLLHIACFFVGEDVSFVELILEDELYAISGILTLINRCLLTISKDRKLMMHQLLQEMARKGSDTIEGLALDMRKVEQRMRSKIKCVPHKLWPAILMKWEMSALMVAIKQVVILFL
ncbi:hypothetical protein L1987_01443 [Smallanthus sonchifolius]|uniref:Uncharacterized protein n=1 Tax=Smallanthus sonchifolius TaxID=185202 RepID=A0ACB9K4Z1_9ASTR|nr:hypothetical protein L1987_01443 [Smallanthus sonchifolius]